MIRRIKHKSLRRLYERGDRTGFPAQDIRRLRNILARLDEAAKSEDMDLPGLNLHSLKGKRKDTWAVTVRANYRVIWKVDKDGAFIEINYEDYH